MFTVQNKDHISVIVHNKDNKTTSKLTTNEMLHDVPFFVIWTHFTDWFNGWLIISTGVFVTGLPEKIFPETWKCMCMYLFCRQ